VNMRKAVREYPATGAGPLTRVKDGPGLYSASGVNGDPTLATREKGQGFVEALVAAALDDIEAIRTAPLPVAKTTVAPLPVPLVTRPPVPRPDPQQPNGCLPSDEREIRLVGPRFSSLWTQMDAKALAYLFTPFGDIRHPDTTIERGREVLMANRFELFRRPEYRDSKHNVTLGDIRCVGPEAAIADGKWSLRMSDGESSGRGRRGLGAGQLHSGLCTLIFVKKEGAWQIEAWRYTVDPANGEPPPTTLKQPGFIGRGGQDP
jgi:hypothetical protein